MRLCRDRLDFLRRESNADKLRPDPARRQPRQRPVVVALAVAESGAGAIERDQRA